MNARRELLEREGALERVDEALGAGREGHGCVLLIEGPAGIGKTRVLAAARGRAEAAGMAVLAARGGELESDFAFGVVRQLFEATIAAVDEAQRDALLAGAASLAAPVVAPAANPDHQGTPSAGASAWAVMHGLYWLVCNLAASEPLLVAVDDAHWADAESLRWLAYVGPRLQDLPVTLIVTVRTGEPARGPLMTLTGDRAVERLWVNPLSPQASERIVRAAFDSPADEFCTACHTATAGNPFLLTELLNALHDAGVSPTSAAARHVPELGPASISRAVVARLRRLSADAHALAGAAALLGNAAQLRHAAALASLDASAASAAADMLGAAQILDGRPLEFVHPVIRSSIYADLPPAQRALGHARAARLLAAEGGDLAEVGAHLLACEPAADPEVVELLRRAARETLARAAPDSAVLLLRRALREPVHPDARPGLLADLGRAELLARDPAAIGHLRQAIALTPEPERRLELTFALAEVLYFAGHMREAHTLITRTIDDDCGGDESLDVALETMRAWMGWGWSDPHHAARTRERLPRLRTLAERSGPAGRALSIYIACKLTVAGEFPADGVALIKGGLDDGRLVEDETADALGVVHGVALLAFHDQLTDADRHLEHILGDAARRGSIMGFAGGLAWRAFTALRRGSITAGETDARRAFELVEEHEMQFVVSTALDFLVEALVERGQHGECEAALARVTVEPAPGTLTASYLLQARSRLRIAQGRPREAVADLRSAGETLQALGIENPNVIAWRSTLALALPADAAEERHTLVDTELTWAHRARQPRGLGVALRAKGLITGGTEGISHLQDAARVLEACPSALEQARTLTELGSALRRANHRADAREPLREALELAHRCGATILAQRARDELQATGARPRSLMRSGIDALTPTERRISAMAADGLSNPEIAQALFIARKTVENHLANAYRKLDIRTRDEIPPLLSAFTM